MSFKEKLFGIGNKMQAENATLREALVEQSKVRFKDDVLDNGVTRLVHNHAVNKAKLGVEILNLSKHTYNKRIAEAVEAGVIGEHYVYNKAHMYTLDQVHALMEYFGFEKYSDHFEPKVVSVQNYKGGTGKSTTTISLAIKTALDLDLNARVLIVDLDPQGSAARGLITLENENEAVYLTAADLLCAEFEPEGEVAGYIQQGYTFEQIVSASPFRTHIPNLSVLTAFPTDEKFTDTYWALNDEDAQSKFLQRFAQEILPILKQDFDVIYLDLPPQNSPITWSALEAADMVLAPITPRTYDYTSTTSYILTLAEMCDSLPSAGKNVQWFKILPVNYNEKDKQEKKIYNRLLRTVGSDLIPKPIVHSPLFLEVAEMNRSIYDITKSESTCTSIQFDEAVSSVNAVYNSFIDELKVLASKGVEE
ncbi:ParA family protein [Vibrio cholerae]|uniref:ParA family protein n=1 Tax=Vibrio cholerae TaxID=666 RepID=UPI00308073E7